jgi:hypothetical protein
MLGGGCKSFSSEGSEPPSQTDGGDDAAGLPDAGVVAPELEFLNSRTTTSIQGTGLSVNSPAGVKPGDLLVAACMASHDLGPTPKGWAFLQSQTVELWGAQGERLFILFTHIVADGESDATAYDFSDSPAAPSSVAVLAFRGARSVQPADPFMLAEDSVVDGGISVPGFTARGRSIAVMFLGSANDGAGFPTAEQNFTRDEPGPYVAAYHGALLPGDAAVSSLDVAVTTPSGDVGVALLGVVEAP